MIAELDVEPNDIELVDPIFIPELPVDGNTKVGIVDKVGFAPGLSLWQHMHLDLSASFLTRHEEHSHLEASGFPLN